MITSKYNFMIPYKDGDYLAYNAVTNDLAIIDSDEYKIYEKLEKDGIIIEDMTLREKLIEGGFIYQDNIDELDVIRMKMNQARFGQQSLGITIAPTSDCNFRCVYCFEKNVIQPIYMNEETENHIIEYIKSKMPEIKQLSIAWYGGEPLLGYESIKRLSRRVIELCDENNVQYKSKMITNGYLLTADKIKELVNMRVINYQITVDGGCKMHNMRRALQSGKGTYDAILNNVKLLAAYDEVTICIRINVDKENIEEIDSVLETMSKLSEKDNILCYLGHVEASEGCYKEESCLENAEYAKLSRKFNNALKEKGMIPITFEEYPATQYGGCCATSINALVINADGKIYKCWNEIGNVLHCVGDIADSLWMEKYYAENLKFLAYDPTRDEECSKCKYLPLCMGGCPFKRVNQKERCYIRDFTDIERMMICMADYRIEIEKNRSIEF